MRRRLSGNHLSTAFENSNWGLRNQQEHLPFSWEPNSYGNHESQVPVMTPALQRQFGDLSYACSGGGKVRPRISVAAGEPARHGHPGAMLVRRLLPSAHGERFGAPALEGQSCLPISAMMSDCGSLDDSSAGCRELRSGPTRWRRHGPSGHHACPCRAAAPFPALVRPVAARRSQAM